MAWGPPVEDIAKMFGVSPDKVKVQFARNAIQLRKMEQKARKTGKKVNGFTADEHAKAAANAEEKSK